MYRRRRENRRLLLSKFHEKEKIERNAMWRWIDRLFADSQNPFSDRERLVDLANDAFPPRMDLKVLYCDIGKEFSRFRHARLGEIEALWKEKPDWAVVRWIHAPLGTGLVHSSFEDMFRHDW